MTCQICVFCAALLAVTAAPALRARAQMPPRAAAPAAPAAPITLEAALALTRPGEAGIVALAVGAQKTKLPKDAHLTEAQISRLSPAQIGRRFEQTVRRFAGVDAIGPPTMTVLASPPAHSNPWDGMPQGEVVKLLAGSLTPGQWTAFLSKSGLGMGDLRTDAQRALFRALFPDNRLHVQFDVPDSPNRDDAVQDVSGLLAQSRLRLGRQVIVELPVVNQSNMYLIDKTLRASSAPHRYIIVDEKGDVGNHLSRINGATVRTETANRPKTGGLNTEAEILNKRVSVTGLRTVGDLMARIRRETGREIFADYRYEGKEITVAGAGDAPAGGLLRAVAFCVTGTYRKVGASSWVLTDDIVGVGTRRQLWADFEKNAAQARASALAQAAEAIDAVNPAPQITSLTDPLALSAAQQEAAFKKQAGFLKNPRYEPNSTLFLKAPLSELTREQQDAARRILEANKTDVKTSLEGEIMVQSYVAAELLLPGFDGPVNLHIDLKSLFNTSSKRSKDADSASVTPTAVPKVPTLADVLPDVPHRAVYAYAKNEADVDAILADMQTLGLNELWLDVFSARTGQTAATEILAHALQSAKDRPVRVFAVIDLLAWQQNTPDAVLDRDIIGATLTGAASAKPNALSPDTVFVSPFAPQTADALLAAIQAVVKQPGLAGMVWRETAPSGYAVPTPSYYARNYPPALLGYTEPVRAAFLRKAHTDPVDLFALDLFPNVKPVRYADTRLPNMDEEGDVDIDRALDTRWTAFRYETNLAFLRRIARAVPPEIPLFLQAASDNPPGNWYGLWEERSHRPPPYNQTYFAPYEAVQDEQAQAKSSSVRLAVVPLAEGTSGPAVALLIRERLAKGGWSGVLLDTVPPAHSVNDAAKSPLKSLTELEPKSAAENTQTRPVPNKKP